MFQQSHCYDYRARHIQPGQGAISLGLFLLWLPVVGSNNPETCQAINLLPSTVTVLCRMVFYPAMNLAFSGNTGVTRPRIGTDATASF